MTQSTETRNAGVDRDSAVSTTEDEVRAILDSDYAAWAAGDADAFVANYTENATVCLPGVLLAGRPTIRDYLAAGFAGPLRDTTCVDNTRDIRISGNTAIVVSQGGVLMAGEDSVPEERQILATWVLLRDDDQWQVAGYHNGPAHR
jgi:uncharacterized protein (TIGR02246 family)